MKAESSDRDLLDDDLFCQGFEVRTLAGIIAEGRLEGWVPGFGLSVVERDHLERSRRACRRVRDTTVLDVACGGSRLLADEGGAALVVSCDCDGDTARYASLRHSRAKLHHSVADATALPFLGRLDVVVGFETIEHLQVAAASLRAVQAALVPGGVLVISSPIAAVAEDRTPANPHHVTEWGFEAFHALVGRYFRVDEV